MKKLLVPILILSFTGNGFAQENWFRLYTDSVSLVKDGNSLTVQFLSDVKAIQPGIAMDVKAVLHTTPYLIYYGDKTVNLPLWQQVDENNKQLFTALGGNSEKATDIFAGFFNGFYLPHELAHALQETVEGPSQGSYANEYFANTVAMLWWRKQNKQKELQQCYEYAKAILTKLPDPVPKDQTMETYFTNNYDKVTGNSAIYGYMQFSQFIQVYEDTTLPSFSNYIKAYSDRRKVK